MLLTIIGAFFTVFSFFLFPVVLDIVTDDTEQSILATLALMFFFGGILLMLTGLGGL